MKYTRFSLILLLFPIFSWSQNVDIENVGKEVKGKVKDITSGKAFRVSGGLSANSVFYNTDQPNNSRLPFTYFLQGNLNFGFLSWSMPVSYSFTNQGNALDYQIPFKFNRLSLHPKYKWIQGHLGDVSMSFSPYTLSGLTFTGAGVELTPTKIPVKFSAMGGRFLKAVEDDGDNRTIPAFKRMGYGAKILYEKEKYQFGVTGFYAKDDLNSISNVPDEKNVLPKENLVLSLEGKVKIKKNVDVFAEYASTAITQDLRAAKSSEGKSGLAGLLFNSKASTEYYKAYKAGLDYTLEKTKLGLQYERIDPGYQTLGANYFNNDFENITFNATQTLFKDKVNLALNVGYQKDDLDNQKSSQTGRMVGSINANVNVSEKLVVTGSYSNFTTYTNMKMNQFDNINDPTLIDNATDTLDYKQVSQNANLNVNYNFGKGNKLTHNMNLNYSLSDVANEQGGIVRVGQGSTFHNVNAAYTLGMPEQKMNINTSLNYTHNTVGYEDANTYGASVNVNKKFLDNKLNSTLGVTYNQNQAKAQTVSVFNIRANLSYVLMEKHNFTLSLVEMMRNSTSPKNNAFNELTVTVGYNYKFDNLKLRKEPKTKKTKIEEPKEEKVKKEKIKEEKQKETEEDKIQDLSYIVQTEFNHKSLEAAPNYILQTIDSIIQKDNELMPDELGKSLFESSVEKDLSQQILASKDKKELQKLKKTFVEAIAQKNTQWEEYKTFKENYDQALRSGFSNLRLQAFAADRKLDNEYFFNKFGIDLYQISEDDYQNFSKVDTYVKEHHFELDEKDRYRLAHYNLLNTISTINTYDDFIKTAIGKQVQEAEINAYYQDFKQNISADQIKDKMVLSIANAYFNQYFETLK